ncbi:hypothetical protein BGW80DRAFT_1263237 [Lactifluus volemus]|nr:hypothetical protein BGW80DRAFT_1263237 [Lactifluus volemus]
MSEHSLDPPLEMDNLPIHPPSTGKSSASHNSARSNYAVGICLLLLVVFLWTASNFVTQDLFIGGYEKPFLITYLTTSSFSLYLVPYLIRNYVRRRREDRLSPSDGYEPLANEEDTLGTTRPYPSDSTSSSHLTTRETARLASVFCFSGFFTLIIGRIFHVDYFTIAKVGAVATSFVGVVLVSLSDSDSPPAPRPPPAPTSGLVKPSNSQQGNLSLFGDSLALLSALFYAFYVILLKVRIRSESRIDMQLFFGFVGLFNTLACWPIGVILHFTGVERFELPTSGRALVGLLANMFITLSSDYVYVLAMLKTTPLVVTIGLTLQHPVKAQVILGAALVLVSFVVIGLEDAKRPPGDDLGVQDEISDVEAIDDNR